MKSYEVKTLINARKSTVWEIITDGGNYTVWESGITHISGGLRNGGTIRVRSRTGGNRTFRLRVKQVPGEVMTWTGCLALGLFQGMCTFTLTSHGEKTLLHVRQDLAGPLLGLLWKTLPDIEPAFAEYLSAVKQRAELLSRHEARIHASPGQPWDVPGERSVQPSARDTPHRSRTLLPTTSVCPTVCVCNRTDQNPPGRCRTAPQAT